MPGIKNITSDSVLEKKSRKWTRLPSVTSISLLHAFESLHTAESTVYLSVLHPYTRVREIFHFKGVRVRKRRYTLGLHPPEKGVKGDIRVIGF